MAAFRKEVPELPPDHPALRRVETVNHTVCADQTPESVPVWIYEWPQFAVFLAVTMQKEALFAMRDPLARVNVMCYGEGKALNWHVDRSEFTTSLLLQEPSGGGEFHYRSNLRSNDDPNHDGVARVLEGNDPGAGQWRCRREPSMSSAAGTSCTGSRPATGRSRATSRCSPATNGPASCSAEQVGFYGRAA